MSLSQLATYLNAHPYQAYLVAWFFAFLESLAVVGSIVPGAVTMTAVGALVGNKNIGFFPTWMWATCGAMTGDYLSYWFGKTYAQKITHIWPFKNHPTWLVKGEGFFKKYGAKSVIIGRFIGPMRSMVPMIAGVLNMARKTFIFAMIPSALLWSLLYMSPGILLGALSKQFPPHTASHFFWYGLGLIAGIWAFIWLISQTYKTISAFCNRLAQTIWNFMKKHQSLNWLTTFLQEADRSESHRQLLIGIILLLTSVLFWCIASSVLHQTWAIKANSAIYHLFLTLRTPRLDDIAVALTFFGDKHILIVIAGGFTLWLLLTRHYWSAIHLGILTFLSGATIWFLKNQFAIPRPEAIMHDSHSFSFPSGHAAFSTAIYGFLIVLLGRILPKHHQWIPYAAGSTLILLITTSRLYLGAHWLSDVIAGMILGICFALLFTLSLRRQHHTLPKAKSYISLLLVIMTMGWISYAPWHFRALQDSSQYNWAQTTITLAQWWQHHLPDHTLPLYRTNRLGKPVQILNVQVLSELDTVKDKLLAQGWKNHPTNFSLETLIQRLSNTDIHLPIIPFLYKNNPPQLLMTYEQGNQVLVFCLWPTRVIIQGDIRPLWVGSTYLLPKSQTLTSWQIMKKANFTHVSQGFKKSLKNYRFRTFTITEPPLSVKELIWDNRLLLLESQKR